MIKRVIRTSLRWKKKLLGRAFPIRSSLLNKTLNGLIPQSVEIMFVHSSLSSCGFIAGGPATVVSALRSKCGTLVIPTHSYCYAEKSEAVGVVFDPSATHSVVGAISDWFWQQPHVVRSHHPTHSLAAIGPAAKAICNEHECADSPCGAGTPYQRLIEQQAAVLMFGCTMNTYTLFHTSEALAGCPYLYYPDQVHVRYVDTNGQAVVAMMWRQNMEYARRFTCMEEELANIGLLKRAKLRVGKLLFIPNALDVHNYLMDCLRVDPRHLLRDS